MATSPDLHEPQIAAARAQAWHQAGDALLTLDAARSWLNDCGLLLFGPRPALAAAAPSLIEATLGEARAAVTAADAETARSLVARLVGEGSAIPLNLLGGPGDLPDFIVSSQAFPFVFTLRGDKGWKRPPETTGAVKVTPLALRVYEVLSENGALTVADIVQETGREVTDSAVARALSELWQMLRVMPTLQQGAGATQWELTTARFLKAIKAGANAGQPTALSALVSLYLAQAYIATEEEIAGFLSPLTARSRVRDVLHGLTAGRQLSEAVLNGKTVLYIPDALPDFAQFSEPEIVPAEAPVEPSETAQPEDSAQPKERIQSFGREGGRPQDRNLRGKPLRREGTRPAKGRPVRRPSPGGPREGDRRATGRGPAEKRSFAPRGDRPVRRSGGEGSESGRRAGGGSSFTRPWDEERGSQPPRPSRAPGPDRPYSERPGRPYSERPGRPAREDRPARPFRERQEGRPPRREQASGERPGFRRNVSPGAPSSPRGEGGSERRPASRPAPRGDRPQRPYRERPADDTRPARPFRPRPADDTRPARPFRSRQADDTRPARPFRPRPAGASEGAFRTEGRPQGRRDDRPRPSTRPDRGENGSAGNQGRGGRPGFGGKPRPGEARPSRGENRPDARSAARPGARGGTFRSAPKKGGANFGSRPPAKSAGRPNRPARGPRREDKA